MDPREARTRAAVLQGGRALLAEGGLSAVTHARVAERAGVGRRTTYRHWATRDALLHDVLAGASAPTWTASGDLTADVRAHLEQLRTALVDGALSLVVAALAERAAVDATYVPLRARLVETGCAPLRARLQDALREGALPAGTDVDVLLARLEGPLFYEVLVRGRTPSDGLLAQVAELLTSLQPDGPAAGQADT